MKKLVLAVFAGLFLIGCSGTMPVQAGGQIEKYQGSKVTASVSSMNILGFTPMGLETAEGAITELQKQCTSGKVTGVTAMVKHTWLFIIVNEAFEVSGYCVD